MVWCGVVWCGVVWCGVFGVVWCGVVWCGVVWCGVCGVVWCGVVCVFGRAGIIEGRREARSVVSIDDMSLRTILEHDRGFKRLQI